LLPLQAITTPLQWTLPPAGEDAASGSFPSKGEPGGAAKLDAIFVDDHGIGGEGQPSLTRLDGDLLVQ